MIQNLRRAIRSTTRNIAEGFGRFHLKDNIRFCRISKGSLYEIKDDLLISVDEKSLSKDDMLPGLELVENAIHSLNGYIRYLRLRQNNQQ